MKIKRLLSLAMLCIAWVGSAWADTTLLTEANGWQKVTDLSSLTLSDYYFAFVDNDKDLMLSFEEGVDQSKKIENKTMVYRTGARAEMTPAMLWVISETPDNAMIRSVVSNLFMQCETDWNANPAQLQPWYCHTNDVSSNTSGGQLWARWGFTYADGSWTIENKKIASNYIGPWTNGAFQNGMQVAGNKTEAAHIGHFQIYAIKRSDVDWLAAASQNNPANISYKITNANAGFKGTSGWSTTGPTKRNDNNGFDLVGGFLEFWSGETWSGSFSQDISNLSSGKYRIRVAGQQSASGVTSTLTAGTGSVAFPSNGTSNGNILASGEETTDGNGTLGWRYVTTETYVTDGNLTIKIESEGGNGNWANFDNVELYYFGNGVELVAEAKNAGETFTTEAGKWYVIPVATDGDYVFTVGDGSNVTYTQKGNTPESGTFSTATSSVACSLTKGYVYLKTETATNVNFDASSYTYTVGEATADVSCIQSGKTVTISYNGAVTNDPTATFEQLGTVTFNGTTITTNLSNTSFTFTVPEGLETSKAYTLSIPAGAFGYRGQKTCEAQTITFNTPAVFDGTYFVKAADETYISRGAEYGTEAARDPWGIALMVATDGNNVTTFTFIDNVKPLGVATGGDMYTDNDKLKYEFTLTAVEGGYNIKNKYYDTYVVAGTNSKGKDVAKTAADPYVWTLVDPAAHATEMTALKNNQAVSAATSAKTSGATGLDGVTDVESLKKALTSWPEGNAIELPALNSTAEFYQAYGTRSAEVEITTAGLYKFAMPAYCRPNSSDKAYSTYCDNTDALTAYIFIGDTKTQVRSLYSEEGKAEATTDYVQPAGATQWWPNQRTTGTAEFNAGKYVNEVWVWLETGKYNFGIGRDGKGECGDWTWFGTPTLTLYSQDLYPTFAELYEKCKPWTESTAADDYVAIYNSYSTYTEATEIATLQAAINYLNENFDTYAWDNASIEHPYDTKKIVNPSYDNGETGWLKAQNSSNGYNDGIDANGNNYYYTASKQIRHASIYQEGITLKPGTYRLSANMYGDILNETSTYIYATDGKVDHWANSVFAGNVWMGYLTTTNEWTNVSCYIVLTAETTLRIGALSWGVNRDGNTKGNFRVDDWKLEYVKYVVDNTNGVVTAYGPAPLTEINSKISANTNVVDLSQASDLSNAAITTTANPNMIIYAKSGAVSNSNNVVIDGTCKNLVLTDGYPFTATKNFTATNASYNMTAIAGGKFGTLMLPFTVSTKPGKAYSLDADINAIDGTIKGSEVTSINANSPVLVTAAGNYTGSNVEVAVTSASSLYTNGNLTGVYQATSAPVGSYVLQNHNPRGVAFYLVKDVQPTVKPFRAFIPAQSSNVKSIKILFDGETTGISSIDTESNAANETIYDLSGRKVNNARKGVYIINGKKIVK